MGREVKRVPLDFDWPLRKIWEGFLNPHDGPTKCPDCDGSGWGPEARHFAAQWYGNAPFDPSETGSEPFPVSHPHIVSLASRNCEHTQSGTTDPHLAFQRESERLARHWNSAWSHHLSEDDVKALVDDDRLWDFTRRPRDPSQETLPNGWTKGDNGYMPTAREVNEWSLVGFGHDGLNQYICVRAKCERLGHEPKCPRCQGEGEYWPEGSEELRALYEGWEQQEPPEGEGYQVWETVSEGSPISPVFKTQAEGIRWLVGEGYSGDAARSFMQSGWVPSMVMIDGETYKDIESASLQDGSEQ